MKKLSKLLRTRKGIEWNYKEHHISCLNHVINIGVQAFLQKCKVLDAEAMEEEEEENEGNDSDDDTDAELGSDAEDDNDVEALLKGDEIREITVGFQQTIWNLRQIGKVILLLSLAYC